MCIQCTLHRLSRVNRYISTYTYHILFERQGWAKSTSKNVTKAYLDIQIGQITANHYTIYDANNYIITNDIVMHGCTHPLVIIATYSQIIIIILLLLFQLKLSPSKAERRIRARKARLAGNR